MSNDLERTLQEITTDRVLQFARSIVAIPSPRFEETRLARYLANHLDLLGLEVRVMPVEGPGWKTHQVIAKLTGTQPGPRVLLHAHLDTGSGQYEGLLYRPQDWTRDPYAGEVDAGYLYGLGTHNNKNGIIATVQAVESLIRSQISLSGEVVVAFVALETAGGIGSQQLIEEEFDFEHAIITEGTGQNIVTVSVGNFRARLIIEGEHQHHGSHTSPIDVAADLLNRMTPSYSPTTVDSWLTFEPDPTFPNYPRVAIRKIESPDLDHCILYVDIVTVPSQTADGVLSDIRNFVRTVEAVHPGARIAVDSSTWISPYIENNLYGGLETPHTSAVVQVLSEAHENVLGKPPNVGTTGRLGAASDASIFRRAGIATIEYGPGSIDQDLGHWPTTDERVRVADLVSCSKVIARAVAQLCR